MIALAALIGVGFIGALLVGSSDTDNAGSDVEDIDHESESHSQDVSLENLVEFFEAVDLAEEEGEANPVPETVTVDGLEFDTEFLGNRDLIVGGEGNDTLDGHAGTHGEISQHVFAGDSDDFIVGGDGDILVGGSGNDTFVVHQGETIQILDYQADEMIVLDFLGENPVITGDANDDGTTILADGLPVVHLYNVFDFDFAKLALSNNSQLT